MDNHYHLLLRTNEIPLSRLMRPLNGGYARWYNAKYSRKGYLFQDRFKSIICQDMEYALELIRYINLNPIRAGKVKSLATLIDWKWCGHAHIMGKASAAGAEFQDRKETLRRFGQTEKMALAKYMLWLEQGICAEEPDKAGQLPQVSECEIAGSFKGWPAVIGDPEFAKSAMDRHKIRIFRKHRQADYESVLKKTCAEICAEYGIKSDMLLKRGRQNIQTQARAAFAYRTHCEELLPLAVIADFLRMTISPLVRLIDKHKVSSAHHSVSAKGKRIVRPQ